jgi:Cu(I)/Ag(I) efflux system membrane protein CusA/SilA
MMKRVSAPMFGGMLTSTVLTLVVIPAVYSLWKERTREPGMEVIHAD